jgi:hypothetical protein
LQVKDYTQEKQFFKKREYKDDRNYHQHAGMKVLFPERPPKKSAREEAAGDLKDQQQQMDCG